MIISSCLYHLNPNKNIETWRFEKKEEFNGHSYYEIITSLRIEDAIIFEMNNYIKKNIFNMVDLIKNNNDLINIKLEDLAHDRTKEVYKKLFLSTGLNKTYEQKFIDSFIKESIWYLRNTNLNNSTIYVSEKWRELFNDKIEKEYLKIYKNVDKYLSY